MLVIEKLNLDQDISACCTEKLDAGVSDIRSCFHLYIPTPKGEIERTFCGILTDNFIDQGIQGKLKDAKTNCLRCDKTLQRVRNTLEDEGKVE